MGTKDMIAKHKRGYILLANSFILVGMIGFGDSGPYKTMSGAIAVDIGGKTRKGDVTAWMGVASNGSAAVILLISGFIPAWAEMFKILTVLAIGCIVCSGLIINYDTKFKPVSGRELP